MSGKRVVPFALTTLFFALSSIAEAQKPGKIPQIGILEARGPYDRPQVLAAFRQGLRNLGYIEGENIVFEYRYADGNNQHLSKLGRT